MIANNKMKEIDIKSCIYHYFDDIICIKNLESKNTKINKKNHIKISLFSTLDVIHQMFFNLCVLFLFSKKLIDILNIIYK